MSSFLQDRNEKCISDFFTGPRACATRKECDAFAGETFGSPVEPVALQGLYSYTITAGADGCRVIVQFRDPDSPLDVKLLAAARRAHPDFVAECRFYGAIGSLPRPLLIYTMDVLPGETYFGVSLSREDDDLDHQLAAVRSLARFFAQSWHNRLILEPDAVSDIHRECATRLAQLERSLPARFKKAVTQVQDRLPGMFSRGYPLVLTHGELGESNILVSPETGEITGVVDWAEAGVLPFGFSLYALDHFLGYLSLEHGWINHRGAEQLWEEFWRVFRELAGDPSEDDMELIYAARLAGMLLRYGTSPKPGLPGLLGLKGADDSSIKFLDALIGTALERTQKLTADEKAAVADICNVADP